MCRSFWRLLPTGRTDFIHSFGRSQREAVKRHSPKATMLDVQRLEPRLALAVIDTTAPEVRSITPPRPRTYSAGNSLSFTLNFTERVLVTGIPTLPVAIGDTVRQAVWNGRGSGGNNLVFRTAVQPGDSAPAGVRIVGPLGLPAGTAIRDRAGNSLKSTAATAFPMVKVDAVGPSVTEYGIPNVTPRLVSLHVTFSEPVIVKGKPSIPFTLAGVPKQLGYAGGSGRNVLTFTYKPVKVEMPTVTNVVVPTQSIRLNGGTITDAFRNDVSSLSIPKDNIPVVVDLVTVGDAGNAADTNPAGYGAVDYEYRIGKYKITLGQYATFLNAVAKSDPYGLFSTGIASNSTTAGISRAGVSGSYRYSVTNNGADTEITNVGWFDAARFTNWMSNGQPIGPQGPTTTENGTYTLDGAPSGMAPAANTTNPNTGSTPLFRIPTENEWYKAAYYKGGSTDAGYWNYATQTDSLPRKQIPGTVGFLGLPATVEIMPDSPSAYGTFNQNGTISEWNDLDGSADDSRGRRGGSTLLFDYGVRFLSSSDRAINDLSSVNSWPRHGTGAVGFRLVSPVAMP